MKRLLLWLVVLALVGGAGAAGYSRFRAARQETTGNRYRVESAARRDLTRIVTATGTVQPVQSVEVGSFVSGPVKEVYVDFNSVVKKGQLLAKIDPRLYTANQAHEEASLANSKADLLRVQALLEQALRDEKRALKLKPTNAIAETDLDAYVANRKALEAQVELRMAAIRECEANLTTARTNLEFTDIQAPVDGIIIDRKVDPGQTVAASFQTPTMFIVAPDLDKKVYVWASVDEADIGLVRDAQTRDQPVTFTVDAYPQDLFHGKITQVRLNPTTVQNVVTYTVIVEAPNVGLKLIPGLTANLTFQIEKHIQALTIPNTALRFRPKMEYVREQDRPLLLGENLDGQKSAEAAVAAHNRKIVWTPDGDLLAAVEITVGPSDKNYTEVASDNLPEGREIVTGLLSSSGG